MLAGLYIVYVIAPGQAEALADAAAVGRAALRAAARPLETLTQRRLRAAGC